MSSNLPSGWTEEEDTSYLWKAAQRIARDTAIDELDAEAAAITLEHIEDYHWQASVDGVDWIQIEVSEDAVYSAVYHYDLGVE